MSLTGPLRHWNGINVQELPAASSAMSMGVAASSATDVWLATGEGLFHWDGSAWNRPSDDAARESSAVLVRGPGDVWAATSDGVVSHLEGASWRSWKVAAKPGRPELFDGVDGSVWLTLDDAIFRERGGTWEKTAGDLRVSVNERISVNDLWTATDGTAWAVGNDGLTLHFDGRAWARSGSSVVPMQVRAIGGSAEDDVWVAGLSFKLKSDVLFHWDGRALTPVPLPYGAQVLAFWAHSRSDAWAAGNGLWHWDGTRWSAFPAHTWFDLTTLWGTGPHDVWAGGRDGVLHFDGCRWSNELIERDLWVTHGGSLDRGDAWLEGAKALWSRQAGRWTREPSQGRIVLGANADGSWLRAAPAPGKLSHVVVQSPGAAWALTRGGPLLHWNGQRWQEEVQDLTSSGLLSALWVSPRGDVWTGGFSGLLSKDAPAQSAKGSPLAPTLPGGSARCEPDSESAELESLLGPAESQGSKQPLPSNDAALELARRWLKALRDADVVGLARKSALPFRVTGSSARGCGSKFDGEKLVLDARDTETFRDLLDCVLADVALSGTTPRESAGEWQPAGSALAASSVSGSLKIVIPSGLSARLRRYEKQARELATNGHLLVEGELSDGHGMTSTMLLSVRAAAQGPRVVAVFVDEHFDE
jgi:hypothetical protein